MKNVLVIGAGRFGRYTIRKLHDMGHQILVIDREESRINKILNLVSDARIGDSTNEAFLRSLGVSNYDLCFVTVSSDFQSSLETTYMLKELGAKFVVSRAKRDGQEKLLLRNGADRVIFPEKQVAKWAAINYSSSHILDYIELDEDHALYEVSVPDEWVGKSIAQIDVRKKYNLSIIAVKKNGSLSFVVTPDTQLTSDTALLVLGEYSMIKKLFRI